MNALTVTQRRSDRRDPALSCRAGAHLSTTSGAGPGRYSAGQAALPRTRAHRLRRAFSLVEATIAITIVGIMLVAALNTLGAAQLSEKQAGDRRRGTLLAQDLMAEILQQAYEDPDFGPGSFGLGGDEVGDGSRALWEDVDDYDGWSAAPPQLKDGTELSDHDGWGREVEVVWVSSFNLNQPVGSDQRLKRVTVTATYNGGPVVSLIAVRAAAASGAVERLEDGAGPGGIIPAEFK